MTRYLYRVQYLPHLAARDATEQQVQRSVRARYHPRSLLPPRPSEVLSIRFVLGPVQRKLRGR